MTKRTVYNGGKVITENEQVILTRPRNEYDTNYHAYDKDAGIEYLIDINDIADNEEEYEAGGVMWEEFKLGELETLILYAWKAYDKHGEEFIIDIQW